MRTKWIARSIGVFAFSVSVIGHAAQTISFNPSGNGTSGALTVGTFDWAPANSVQIGGNPAGGVVAGANPTQVILLTHSKLVNLLDTNGGVLPIPSGVEFTYVAGFPQVATSADATTNTNAFTLATGTPNFFEIWVGIPPNTDMLAGTGFNDYVSNDAPPQASHRILYGIVTDASGSFTQSASLCGASTALLDQFLGDDYSGQLTICGTGGTKISVNIISVDVNYFPGVTPDVIDTVKAFFNTANNLPFRQANPSRLFVHDFADLDGTSPPAASVQPNLGTVNGGLQNSSTLDFQTQADANQSFEQATPIAGTCRVTYGGNDKNGNVDLTKFGQACSSDKGNQQNCYTFGGQVGAPSADPAQGGPFGEHTHHNVIGPAGDFVFHAGTHSAPKSTRILATACKDPGACRQAVANASFKQIDFEGTGSFRSLDATAKAYLAAHAGHPVLADNVDSQIYYFRVDMDDTGEPGDKPSKKQSDINACKRFLAADLNLALNIPDPALTDYATCGACADVYQFYICKDENACEQKDAIYAVRGYLTGGNIQMHRLVK
jgi:hypothetical protein